MFKEDLENAIKSQNQPLILIGNYLASREDVDKDKHEGKSLIDCFAFITSVARSKARNNSYCMMDDEAFGLAVHYYDEEKIDFKKVDAKQVQVNSVEPGQQSMKLDDDKKEKKAAKPKPKKKEKSIPDFEQLSLFGD